jgi:hypothetical protein
MSVSNVFGTIHTDDEVEDAVIATLRKWLPTYMSEVERQLGLDEGYYARPAASSFTARSDFEKWPEEMLPLVVVIAPGIEEDPVKDGDGVYRGGFQIGVANICSSTDQVSTRRYTYRMGAAIRTILTQKASLDQALDGDIRGTTWIGTRNTDVSDEDGRTIWACQQLFVVEVDYIMQKTHGPLAPPIIPTDPVPDWPDVATADVSLDKEPIDG